jgi:hypothetical protein
MFEPMEPLKADCIECLEDQGMWYFAQKVRMGGTVYEYEVRDVMERGLAMNRPPESYGSKAVGQLVLDPIVNSAGTNSLGAMMSEGYPPNTGRHYEKA